MIRRAMLVAGLALAALCGCGPKGSGGAYGTEQNPIVFSILSAETRLSRPIWAPCAGRPGQGSRACR